jgi:hypothetical protein
MTTEPSTRREPELPDEDWPTVPLGRTLAVIALMICLVVAVVIA